MRWKAQRLSFESTGVRLVQLSQLYGGKNGVTSIHQGKPRPTQCCCYHRVTCVAHPSSPHLSFPLCHPAQTTSGLWKTRRWSRRATKASRKKKMEEGLQRKMKTKWNGENSSAEKMWWRGDGLCDTLECIPLCTCKGFFKTSQVFGNIKFICIKYIYRITD